MAVAALSSPSIWAFEALALSVSVDHSCKVEFAVVFLHADKNGVSSGEIL